MNNIFLLSQILVCITIVFDIASFQFKNRKIIVLCLFLASSFNATHFFLLEQWTAAGIMAVGSLRYLVSIFSTSKKASSFFLLIVFVISFFTYTGFISILAFSGSALKTVAAFCKTDKHLRILMMVGTFFWIVHNYLIGSPVGALMEVLFLLSNFVGYYRYYVLRPTQT